MGRRRSWCTIIVLAILAASTINAEISNIKKVEYLIDRATNRRIGYVVTKVYPIDRKDDLNETISNTQEATKIDRNALNEEDHEHQSLKGLELSRQSEAQSAETVHESDSNSRFLTENHVHHHEKTVTVVKKVADPYPVEKTVHVPILKKVPYAIQVPVPEPYPVEKQIPYPIKVLVKVPYKVPQPVAVVKESYYPVHVPVDRMVPHRVYIPDPYPVEKKVYYEVKVPVPEPFPIERQVPVPVKLPVHVIQPYPVDKVVHYPVKVEKERPVPVPVIKPYPVPVTKHIPYPVEKVVPYPVKVKVENPVPVPYEKPVPVKVEVPEIVPVPVEKEVHYPVEKPVHYPEVHYHSGKGDQSSFIQHKASETKEGAPSTPREPAKVHEDPSE